MPRGVEGEGPRGEPTSQQPRQGRAEGKQSLQGPTTVDRSEQLQPQQESPERQPLLNVWGVLEREVRLYAPELPRIAKEDYSREIEEISRLQVEMDENGTARDNLTRDLYWTTIRTKLPSGRSPGFIRHLSLEEFQQFRSQVEPLSDEEIAEKIRHLEEEDKRKLEEYRQRHKDDPPRIAFD